MKIAIISDSHDNVPNIEKFIEWSKVNDIEAVIHCGDLAAPAMVKKLFGPRLDVPFHFINGNVADRELNEKVAAEFEQVFFYGDQGEFVLGGKKIAINHYPDQAERLAESGKYDLVFYGHDHKAWEKKIGTTMLYNPGTLAGLFARPTFAMYDTETNEATLILVETLY